MSDNTYTRPVSVRWADLDPNAHVRHSVYYDWGAAMRTEFLSENGITFEFMRDYGLGPILFREEAVFRKEVRFGDTYFINVQIAKMRRDFSRFTFRHEITRSDGVLCAVLTAEGAWMDTRLRKLAVPPEPVQTLALAAPKTADFEWLD